MKILTDGALRRLKQPEKHPLIDRKLAAQTTILLSTAGFQLLLFPRNRSRNTDTEWHFLASWPLIKKPKLSRSSFRINANRES